MSLENNQVQQIKPFFSSNLGALYYGECKKLLSGKLGDELVGRVDLLLTSPPFPLNRKKKYGNLTGSKYVEWLSSMADIFGRLLSPSGSIVIELGSAWESGLPAMSTLPVETLLAFKNKGSYYLCQEFFWFNPAKLPTPVEWVNRKRIRVKDSITRIWWLSKTAHPYADNKNILVEYSESMKKLLKTKKYNSGERPSEHKIGTESFLKDNGGAIPSNLIVASNTNAQDQYLTYCRSKKLSIHPARMPEEVASLFIKFLTKEGQLVLDPFSGSNITGYVAEKNKRKWVSIEVSKQYAKSSVARFTVQI